MKIQNGQRERKRKKESLQIVKYDRFSQQELISPILNKTLKFYFFLILHFLQLLNSVCIMHKNLMSLGSDIISRTVKTQKLFNFQDGRCFYVNIQASTKSQENDEEPVIKIVNSVCKQSASRLSKITQIRFKEKLIHIEDQYFFGSKPEKNQLIGERNSSQPTKSSDGSNHSNPLYFQNNKSSSQHPKKKLIFKKKYLEDNTKIQKRNTKNIAKNFCKAFVNYLEDQGALRVLGKVKQIVSIYNYNNKTIQAYGKDSQIKEQFQRFLIQKAEEWIETSKIHDKKIHKEAIQLYLSLIQRKSKSKDGRMDEQIHSEQGWREGNSQEKNSKMESNQLFEEGSDSSQKIN